MQTIPSPRNEVKEEVRKIIPFHIGEALDVFHGRYPQKRYNAVRVYSEPPQEIHVRSSISEFFYDKNDSKLEKILSMFDDFYEDIPKGLEKIMSFFKLPEYNEIDNESLGEILYSKSAHCRHRAGLLLFLGISQGHNIKIEYSKKDDDQQRHAYIVYKDMIIDPTLNIYGKRKRVLKMLKLSGKSTFYHTQGTQMQVHLVYT